MIFSLVIFSLVNAITVVPENYWSPTGHLTDMGASKDGLLQL